VNVTSEVIFIDPSVSILYKLIQDIISFFSTFCATDSGYIDLKKKILEN